MPHNFVLIYRGSPINVMCLSDALSTKGIVPIVKDPQESARLAGFASLTQQQTLWVHKSEEQQALQSLKSLAL